MVGNGGGFIESIFGFGLYGAIISSVLAAEAIAEKSSFEEKVSFLNKKLYECYLLRQALFRFTNKDYDTLMKVFNIKPLNRLIYNSNLDVIRLTAKLLKPS